jgi:hypothetical protein
MKTIQISPRFLDFRGLDGGMPLWLGNDSPVSVLSDIHTPKSKEEGPSLSPIFA